MKKARATRGKKAAPTKARGTRRKPTKATRARAQKGKAGGPRVKPAGLAQSSPRSKERPTPVRSHEFSAAVKRKAPVLVARVKPGKPPRRSKHPEAIRSRKRRAEARALAEALAAEHERKLEERRRRDRERRRKKKKPTGGGVIKRPPPDERELALGWLEEIRNRIAHVFAVSLEITQPEIGAAQPWLVVGRFDPQEDIGYADLAAAFEMLSGDVLLEAMINPQRLSQIRIVYQDPNAIRGEGDSIVSQIGAWEFILGDLVGELVGGGSAEDPGEGSLASRYDETSVAQFYIYFSSEVVRYVTAGPWQRTQTVSLKR